tara:strand:+ start:4307 stop:5716 length:1410 start_codon:yes stop_codon:yes gene_type:complete
MNHYTRHFGRLAALVLLLGSTACISTRGVGPAYERPESPLPEAFGEAQGAAAERRADWWSAFDDASLEALVLAVRENNRELRAGLARLNQARALVGAARTEGMPQIAVEPSFQRARTSDRLEVFPGVTAGRTANTTTLPFTLGWELDLFGRIQHSIEAAQADMDIAEADFDALLLLLETEAASTYLSMRTIDLELSVVARSVETFRESAALIRRRFDLGAVSELDVARADSLLASREADQFALQRARTTAQYALAVLVGETATGFQVESAPLAGQPPSVPPGLPSELLLARPDLRRSERRLAAENARVGVATAAFYPSLSLTGSAGWQATDASDLFDTDAKTWAIRPQLYMPLFQGGRNQANLDRSRARYEEVVEDYQNSVLIALSEVESALATQRFLGSQSAAQQRAVVAALRARDVSMTQYEVGTADFLDVLDAERTALDAQRSEARLRGEAFLNTVQLLRSLGGRW